MRLTRAAFGVMIKFSDKLTIFEQLSQKATIKYNLIGKKDDRDKLLVEYLQEQQEFEPIIKSWERSSLMRQWIIEKKQRVSEKFEQQLMKEMQQKKRSFVQQELSESEKQFIQDETFKKQTSHMEEVFKKIITKATYMTRLNIPPNFESDTYKRSRSTPELAKFPSLYDQAEEVEPEHDWYHKIQGWKQKQTMKGSIISIKEMKAELQSFGISSILALLQNSIQSSDIQEIVEKTYINACKRLAGIKLIKDLISFEAPWTHTNDLLQWFCSALRQRTNRLSHFKDDLIGQGQILEMRARNMFFDLIKNIVIKLKNASDRNQIKVLLDALKWKYMGLDHLYLTHFQIFQVLHEGDG